DPLVARHVLVLPLRDRTLAILVAGAGVVLVHQHAPNRHPRPASTTAALRLDAVVVQRDCDAPQRPALGVPVEHLAHDRPLELVDQQFAIHRLARARRFSRGNDLATVAVRRGGTVVLPGNRAPFATDTRTAA